MLAGAHPSDLLGAHEPARFEHVQVLEHRRAATSPAAAASSLTEAGPRLSRSTMSRRLGSREGLEAWSSGVLWLSIYLTIAGMDCAAAAARSGSKRADAQRRAEADAQQRPAAGRVLGSDTAAVGLGGLAHDRQAEPRAGQLARAPGAVEAVEDVRQVGLVEAGPVVADGELAVA